MTVDFPTSYSEKPSSLASKPVDMQTLQETFAAILRSYGTEKAGTQTNTLLEITHVSNPDNRDKNQQRRDSQQQIERNEFTQIDRIQRDKLEIRSGEMNADYQARVDRQQVLYQDYQEKIERSAPPLSPDRMDASLASASVTSPMGAASPIESLPPGNSMPPQNDAMRMVNSNSQPQLASATPSPSNVANSGFANAGLPMTMNAPAAMPTPVAPQTSPPSAFTVFTPAGRWGHSQESPDEEETDEEKPDEKKSSKKKQPPFAVFEEIRMETARPIQQNHARQPQEPISKPEQRTVKPAPTEIEEKPNEIEPEQTRSNKTVEDLLHKVEQNISTQKKGEPNEPDQSRYLHRIAAACEAAAYSAPIRMKINLDHLGTLALRFYYKADKLSLRFETPSRESAQFLRGHMDELKAILSKKNVKIVDVEIFSG